MVVRKLSLNLVVATSVVAIVVPVVGTMFVSPPRPPRPLRRSRRPACSFPYLSPRRRDSRRSSTLPPRQRTPASRAAPMELKKVRERFRNPRVGVEVLYGKSAADAKTLLKGLASDGKAQAGLSPPKSLGSTAVERLGRVRPTSSPGAAQRIRAERPLYGPALEFDDEYNHGDPGSAYRARQAGARKRSHTTEREIQECSDILGDRRFDGGCEGAGRRKATSVAAGCPKNPATALQKPKWSSDRSRPSIPQRPTPRR